MNTFRKPGHCGAGRSTRSLQFQIVTATVLGSVLLTGCTRVEQTQPAPQPEVNAPQFFVKTTIREIMDAEVDPAADALWDSVATIATTAGTKELQPRTAEEWQELRRKAIILLEATNLVMMDGRQIAPPDTPVAPGELGPAVLQQKLQASRGQFIGFALALRVLGLKALDAIDAKDPQRLFEVGGEIDEACETCHLVYWYPPDTAPAPKALKN